MNIATINEKIPVTTKESMLSLGFTEEQFYSESHNALAIWNDPKNAYLRKSTKASFLNALINLCKINLSLNPVKKEAYLIPRKNGDNIEVCLEPSYIGLIKLLTNAGVIKNIQTNVVYQGDHFEHYFDINGANFNHKPYYSKDVNNPKGDIKGVYCVAFLTNGNNQFEYMTKDEIDGIKEKSESYKSFVKRKKEGKYATAIWDDYESEMTRKTILRRIYKYLPKSAGQQSDFIDNAVKLDESAFSASGEQIQLIENLLHTSILPEDEKVQIENDFVTMTYGDAKNCIFHLENNQLPAMEMQNPSQTAIRNEIDKK